MKFFLAFLLLFFGNLYALGDETAGQCVNNIVSVKTARAEADGSKPSELAVWITTTLPDNWNLRRSNTEKVVWYRIDWQRTCIGDKITPVSLVLYSVQMAGEVYINDQQLWRDKNLTEPLSRSWNLPRYWQLPRAYLRDGINTIWIKAISVPGQPIGSGKIYLGDPSEMQALYDQLNWNSRTIILVNIILAITMAIMLFFIWIADRRQTAFGWYSLSIVFWLIFISNFLTISPWPFSSSYMIARINTIAMLLTSFCFAMFILRFSRQKLPYIECFFAIIVGVLILAIFFMPDRNISIPQTASLIAASAIFFYSCVQPLFYGLRSGQRDVVLFALGWMVVLCSYFHDLLLVLNIIHGHVALSAYVSLVVTLCLTCIIGLRHAQYLKKIESFNDELSESVTNAKNELSAALKQEYALSMENTRLQDRLQIAHDLHDGLGGSLVHMMASIEVNRTSYSYKEVISMLSLIRNDLRQAIDSGASGGVKVPSNPDEWIAPVRHRYTTLFDELGLDFRWDIAPQWHVVPTAMQCLALTRLIEEALTNVIKHSHAHFIQITLKLPSCDELVLIIEDDGLGFDVDAVLQSGMSVGMRSMRMRISRIGGALDVTSNPGKTTLTARLKL